MFGFSRYQWLVILAAWLGWGFDVFDALLFNFVAPNCIPTLLGLTPGTPEARQPTVYWTGVMSSMLLVGWAIGGLLFGMVADRWGRQRTLLATILLYSVGTGLCAMATDLWQLLAFRAVASLGIGGEWAVGAVMVAEAVPESRRVDAAAIMQSASPAGLLLATLVNYQVAGVWLADSPETSWRFVFLCGLAPAAVALFVRLFLRESDRFTSARSSAPAPAVGALFSQALRGRTASGLITAVAALLSWWSCNAFLPILATGLAQDHAALLGLDAAATRAMAESWKASVSLWFNVGGLLGTFLSIPLARHFGRRSIFAVYFGLSLASLLLVFGLELEALTRLRALFFVGFSVFGIFGVFAFYLPELFPTRLRTTGSGLCYNLGRVIAAVGPFIVGTVSAQAGGSAAKLTDTLLWVGLIPLIGLIATRFIVETRGARLPD
ncbi:MAG: MFS transporter [Gammaproteobacteria bacterium]|nr:MFS transporter [Gammaproteobacteria bacterium]